MTHDNVQPGTAPRQPASTPPVRKGFPLVIALVAIIGLIAVANLTSLVGRNKKAAPASSLLTRPSAVNPQQVSSYESMQATQASQDAQARRTQLSAQAQQLPGFPPNEVPGPEADTVAPMTVAQSQAIYGGNPNAPQRTSGVSQAHAEAKQRQLAREKEHQDALSSDTVAIDFSQQGSGAKPTAVLSETQKAPTHATGEAFAAATSPAGSTPGLEQVSAERKTDPAAKADPMGAYPFDSYGGQLYRVFEGTVLEGVVTNHIDGAFSGPILVMLTTDYYSHDHQQLLMPQGTRLIGTVQGVSGQGQRKLMVTFHRAVCPDGFSLDFDKYLGLDPIGITGLAGKVNNHYLSSFAAAAVIGGLGGIAQIGNAGTILTSSGEIRNGISEETAQESEQILNKFLNRLPTITLKEGSRARVYIGRDILIPSYAEHRLEPTL